MKLQTIDETCGRPDGSFKKFIAAEEEELRKKELERKARIRRARQK